ncbi:hypothetical protein [Kangiella sediminilitoris]|uniref:Uncharacterized protein n=1 Tax=Kangiella sediminilitoris TaxID=1144748 RepID=A0A1B3B8Y6_9GAMM|nr:hypothetical protein [Kangiella sediminilitoris]AOE49264.1 hypothetical protein KS2013_540 [Kangiella sediminilitoris]
MDTIDYSEFISKAIKIQEYWIDEFSSKVEGKQWVVGDDNYDPGYFITQYIKNDSSLHIKLITLFKNIVTAFPFVEISTLNSDEEKIFYLELTGDDPVYSNRVAHWIELAGSEVLDTSIDGRLRDLKHKQSVAARGVLFYLWLYIEVTNNPSSKFIGLIKDITNLTFYIGKWAQVVSHLNSRSYRQPFEKVYSTSNANALKSDKRALATFIFLKSHKIYGTPSSIAGDLVTKKTKLSNLNIYLEERKSKPFNHSSTNIRDTITKFLDRTIKGLSNKLELKEVSDSNIQLILDELEERIDLQEFKGLKLSTSIPIQRYPDTWTSSDLSKLKNK